jgi:hypothetical protein
LASKNNVDDTGSAAAAILQLIAVVESVVMETALHVPPVNAVYEPLAEVDEYWKVSEPATGFVKVALMVTLVP